jgi:mono/diheme cytochrome c family protein
LWGGLYLQRYSGDFLPLVYDENPSRIVSTPIALSPSVELFTQGKRLFADTCGKCHQLNGEGLPGQFPPLAGSEWVQASGSARLIRIVLDGLQGPVEVKGIPYNQAMVPWREAFSNHQIAAVLTYVRGEKEWGNNATAVRPEQVGAVRTATEARPGVGAWSAEELLAIPENAVP